MHRETEKQFIGSIFTPRILCVSPWAVHLGSLFEAQQLDRQSSCGKDTDCTQLIFVLLQQRAEESARTPRTGRSPLALSLFFCLSLQPWAKVARVAVGTRGSSLRSGFRSSSSGWRAGQRKAPRPLASRKPTTAPCCGRTQVSKARCSSSVGQHAENSTYWPWKESPVAKSGCPCWRPRCARRTVSCRLPWRSRSERASRSLGQPCLTSCSRRPRC